VLPAIDLDLSRQYQAPVLPSIEWYLQNLALVRGRNLGRVAAVKILPGGMGSPESDIILELKKVLHGTFKRQALAGLRIFA